MKYADSKCTCIEHFGSDNEHIYIFTGTCVVTRKLHSVRVKAEDLFKYRQGVHIQDAFPYLSVDDREFLISGISKEGWELMYPPDEEVENVNE
jgi:hypothetical protein